MGIRSKNIAEQYILYSRLMDYWRSKFKDDIFDASYEKIINSPEQELKKIISFCDLAWDPECLNFYKNKKTPVQTVIFRISKTMYNLTIGKKYFNKSNPHKILWSFISYNIRFKIMKLN